MTRWNGVESHLAHCSSDVILEFLFAQVVQFPLEFWNQPASQISGLGGFTTHAVPDIIRFVPHWSQCSLVVTIASFSLLQE